jgi:transposase, IS5 family
VHKLPDLLHGGEKKVWGDGGYQGQPGAQDMTCRRTKYKDGVDEQARRKNRNKSKVRAEVEWPFRLLKRVFGFTKVRYRGLKKRPDDSGPAVRIRCPLMPLQPEQSHRIR